ncbi:MAG: cation diffusion facilitator family transporter, partial [Magnetococcales bacterium]|nr:cation diffusion facilitator family transporter [Magnetococcales bacterium]
MSHITLSPATNTPSDEFLERIAWMAVGVNILLIALNTVLGLLSGSIAVGAEAVHNLVDMLGSVGVVVGLRLSRKKNSAFPYGLYKVENIVALLIALLILLAGYEIIKEAVFAPPAPVEISLSLMLGVLLTLIIPVFFGLYTVRVGQRGNSPSLMAIGQEFRMHALTSGAVLLGLAGQAMGWQLDRWAGLFVVLFILQTSWELSRDAMRA